MNKIVKVVVGNNTLFSCYTKLVIYVVSLIHSTTSLRSSRLIAHLAST
jgi:hypothetical protein